MGDFNFVEDDIDRFSARKDDNRSTNIMERITNKNSWVDRWRIHNPIERNVSYFQEGGNSKSRINRIYLNKQLYPYAYNWERTTIGNISDHNMVYVEILKKDLLFIGKGSWRLSQNVLDYYPFRVRTYELLRDKE